MQARNGFADDLRDGHVFIGPDGVVKLGKKTIAQVSDLPLRFLSRLLTHQLIVTCRLDQL